jgi:hypothetical protein
MVKSDLRNNLSRIQGIQDIFDFYIGLVLEQLM